MADEASSVAKGLSKTESAALRVVRHQFNTAVPTPLFRYRRPSATPSRQQKRRGETNGGDGKLLAGGEEKSGCDLQIFRDAFHDYGADVHHLAAHLCGVGLADDVTQRVFLQLWLQPEKFDSARGSLRTFLMMRCRGYAIDALRSQSAWLARHERSQRLEPEAAIEALEDDLCGEELAVQLATALAALPTPEREAITVAFYGRYTYQQAAAVLGQPEGTVKTRIRTGLKHLRVALSDGQ